MCEIAKAISHEAKVIIFDEPTAALTDTEIEQLFKIIRDLRSRQYGIVYISHRMDEIKKITDRVTVMRDGQYVVGHLGNRRQHQRTHHQHDGGPGHL